jgi:hypothetical protein
MLDKGSLCINFLLIFCSAHVVHLTTVVGINKLVFMVLYVQVSCSYSAENNEIIFGGSLFVWVIPNTGIITT